MSFAAVLSRLAKLENPFPGLRPFDTAEAHLFFGRDQQVLDLADRLGRNHFVAVLGLSGSGKSSLVRAGLVPALKRGRLLESGKTWRIAVARPSGAPFANLAAELKCDPADLRSSSHGLIDWAARQLKPRQEALLVIVDQFEELFRYKDHSTQSQQNLNASSEASAFIALLLASSHSPLPIYIVITMRTDYLGDCAEFPEFPEALNESQYLVPRLTREQRRQAVEGPLGRVRISTALVERILNDAGDEPDQLPILQHALMRTWSRWHTNSPDAARPIETQDYEAVGGFSGALNRHADELLRSPTVTVPGYVEIIFKRLTALGRGNRERRDPSVLSELWELCGAKSDEARARVNAIVDVFRKGEATFLAPREGELKPDTYIDIAHESLIRNWKILAQQWLPEEEKFAKTLIELVERAAGWRARERERLSGLDLTSARQWDRRRNPSPKWAEHYVGPGKLQEVQAYIAASRKQGLKLSAIIILLAFTAIALFTLETVASQKKTTSLDLAGRAENLVSLSRKGEALTTAEQALRANKTHQAREALAHSFPQELIQYRGLNAALSPDERIVATSLPDHTVQTWDTASGAALTKLSGHTAQIRSVRFSPDGQRIVTASTDNSARLWEAATGKPIATISAHTDDVTLALFSPNGRFILTLSNDHTARVWDAISAKPIAVFNGHSRPITNASFSPDSQRIVTASQDATAQIWNAATGQLIAKLLGHTGEVKAAIFSPDGERVVTAGADDTARLWNVAAGQLLSTLATHTGAVNAVAFSKDGKLVVTASDDHTALIWNTATNQIVAKLLGHSSAVTSAAFSPDGRLIVTASRDSTIHVWNAASGALLANLTGHNGSVYSAVFSASGLRVLSDGEDNTSRLWNLTAAAKVATTLTGHSDGVNSAAFSPDDERIVTASADHNAWVWNRKNGSVALRLSGHAASVNNARFSADGARIVTASSDRSAWVWDSATAKVLLKLRHTDEVSSAIFSPNGDRILTACNDKMAHIWNAKSGQPLVQLVGHTGMVLSASFSPDGTRVATASDDKSAWIWNANTGAVIQKLQGNTGTVWTATFSKDGQRIVTAGDDGTARVWDANTGKQLLSLEGHGGAVYSAAFSSDGKQIVTASYDKTVRVWDAATGQVIAKLEGHADSVSTANFSHDNSAIVTASLDRTSFIFTLVNLKDMEALLK